MAHKSVRLPLPGAVGAKTPVDTNNRLSKRDCPEVVTVTQLYIRVIET